MTEERPLIHHTGFYASDFDASERIFTAALAALDVIPIERDTGYVEYSRKGFDTPSFCVERAKRSESVTRRVHVAFTASDRGSVERFHDAAVEAGARSKHSPRYWPEYRAYCAFLRDPDGNNIEAVHKEHPPE